MTRRSWLTAATVGGLGAVTLLLVVLALRPAPVPAPPPAPLDQGAIAASDGTMWRWAGPQICNADADAIGVERSEDGRPWQARPIPLANVASLSFASTTRGIATGTTSQCARGVALTDDGGRTWHYRADNPVLLDAWYVGDLVWGIELGLGAPTIEAYRVDMRLRLHPVGGVDAAQPCDAADGAPTQLGFWGDRAGLVLCQGEVTGSRLLVRTTDAGTNFERLTDDRPETGLDGPGSIVDLDTVGTTTVFALFDSEQECREGQVRVSQTQGASFRRLPCPSASASGSAASASGSAASASAASAGTASAGTASVDTASVDTVLDVAFTSPRDGVLLGARGGNPVVLATTNGGQSWTEQ